MRILALSSFKMGLQGVEVVLASVIYNSLPVQFEYISQYIWKLNPFG
jgi:hypothetical protein